MHNSQPKRQEIVSLALCFCGTCFVMLISHRPSPLVIAQSYQTTLEYCFLQGNKVLSFWAWLFSSFCSLRCELLIQLSFDCYQLPEDYIHTPVTLFTCIETLLQIFVWTKEVCMDFHGKMEQIKVCPLLNHREIRICKKYWSKLFLLCLLYPSWGSTLLNLTIYNKLLILFLCINYLNANWNRSVTQKKLG